MSKFYYTYQYYPNCYEATLYSKSRTPIACAFALLGALLTFGLLGIIFVDFSAYLKGNVWLSLSIVAACIIAVAIFDFYAFIAFGLKTHCETEILLAKEARRHILQYDADKYSDEFKEEFKKATRARIKEIKEDYKRSLSKAAKIYFSVFALLIVVVVICKLIF